MEKVIAERKLLFASKGSDERKELIVRVGIPYWVEDGLAACPLELEGLFSEPVDARGTDLLQALHMASDIDFILKKLSGKYDFYWLTGDPYFDDGRKGNGPPSPIPTTAYPSSFRL